MEESEEREKRVKRGKREEREKEREEGGARSIKTTKPRELCSRGFWMVAMAYSPAFAVPSAR